MAQPVWVLSVDLQAKTATFQSGMADAAKAARGSFKDIQSGAGEMSRETGTNMMEARHGVMLLGEEFGVHLPRALTTFIASIGPVGAAMEAAFPFLAIIVGATLLLEHLHKVAEEADKLEQSQRKFETATHNAFNALTQKTLEAGIHTDELNKNHLAALKKQLELIDMQSMDELVHSFDIVSKAADAVFAELKTHWYQQGIGAEGAKHALETFKNQYDLLLSMNRNKEASDLLAGTLESAEKVLHFQKEYIGNQTNANTNRGMDGRANPDYLRFEEASLELKKAGVGATEKEVQAQQSLVEALRAQVNVESKVAELKRIKEGNAKTTTGREETNEAYRRMKEEIDAENAGIAEEDRIRDEARNRAIARIQDGEREKIEATQKGSSERIAAIDAAIKEENNKGLQETGFYRSLLIQRVETVRQMTEEEARIRTEAGREAAQLAQKLGELDVAAEKEAYKLRNSGRRVTQQELIEQDIHFADEEYKIQLAAINKQIVALDKNDRDYSNKLRALYDKQEELERAHQDKITQIKDRAAIEQNARMLAAEQKMRDETAKDLASVLMLHQSFGSMIVHVADQVATGLLESAIKYALTLDVNKRHEAAAAARQGFLTGQKFPFPVNVVMAPALAAAAFESVMGFAEGGIVPGVGRGDTVPAVLTPGEHVADKELTEGLRGMVRSGGGPRQTINLHVRPTYNLSALDADGIDEVLVRHNATITAHVEQTVRRMNQ